MVPKPGVLPATSWPVAMKYTATSMKPTMAATLIIANQNSNSPKNFTLSMFIVTRMASATRAITHCGMELKIVQKST